MSFVSKPLPKPDPEFFIAQTRPPLTPEQQKRADELRKKFEMLFTIYVRIIVENSSKKNGCIISMIKDCISDLHGHCPELEGEDLLASC